MSRVTRPRRPLPRRVYWTRRVLVLGVAPALLVASVVGLAHLLGGSSGGSPDAAVTVGSSTTVQPSSSPTVSPSATPSDVTTGRRGARAKGGRHALPQPVGACQPSDVLVTPSLPDPHAYGPSKVVLELTTHTSPACTFEVKPQSVFLTISSNGQVLWSSEDCPATIPTRTVVPRLEHAARVRLTWNGKESDATCSKYTSWVDPGNYVASAVARGSVSPVQVGFHQQQGIAVRPTITVSPTATPTPSPTPTPSSGASGTASPSSGH